MKGIKKKIYEFFWKYILKQKMKEIVDQTTWEKRKNFRLAMSRKKEVQEAVP